MRPPPWQHCLLLLKNPFLEKNIVNIFVSLYHIALQCSAISILFILVNVHILMVSLYSCILYPYIRKCSISLSSWMLYLLYTCPYYNCTFASLYPDFSVSLYTFVFMYLCILISRCFLYPFLCLRCTVSFYPCFLSKTVCIWLHL